MSVSTGEVFHSTHTKYMVTSGTYNQKDREICTTCLITLFKPSIMGHFHLASVLTKSFLSTFSNFKMQLRQFWVMNITRLSETFHWLKPLVWSGRILVCNPETPETAFFFKVVSYHMTVEQKVLMYVQVLDWLYEGCDSPLSPKLFLHSSSGTFDLVSS